VSAVLDKDDIVVSDELKPRQYHRWLPLSRAAIKVFPHKDAGAARKILQSPPARRRTLPITDGVLAWTATSTSAGFLLARRRYGCIMMVDDARASGVFGANGRGTIDHFDARTGRHPGGNAIEGHRRARRLRRRHARTHRVFVTPRTAVSVLELHLPTSRPCASRRSTC
jgi:7-keto-8-aminopelargonate synthetase-like enzyme